MQDEFGCISSFLGLYRTSSIRVSFPSPYFVNFLVGQELKVWIASQLYLQIDTRRVVAYRHDHLLAVCIVGGGHNKTLVKLISSFQTNIPHPEKLEPYIYASILSPQLGITIVQKRE